MKRGGVLSDIVRNVPYLIRRISELKTRVLGNRTLLPLQTQSAERKVPPSNPATPSRPATQSGLVTDCDLRKHERPNAHLVIDSTLLRWCCHCRLHAERNGPPSANQLGLSSTRDLHEHEKSSHRPPITKSVPSTTPVENHKRRDIVKVHNGTITITSKRRPISFPDRHRQFLLVSVFLHVYVRVCTPSTAQPLLFVFDHYN